MLPFYQRPVRARLLRLVAVLILACIEVSSPNQTRAATLTWTGGAGNGNLLTAANWTPTQAPVTGDTLIFAGSTSLINTLGSSAFSVATITFDATAGAFVLNGTNTLTISTAAGITTNSTATQTINSNLAVGIAQTWNTNTGASLVVNGNLASNVTLTLAGAGLTTINGIISGTGSVSKSSTGSGTLQLNGANTYTGTTTLSTGTVQIGNNAAFGTGTVSVTSSTLKLEAFGSARTLANNFSLTKTLILQGANDLTLNGTVNTTSSRTITVNGAGILTINGNLTQSANGYALSKSGVGTLVLNGNNTYSGTTTVSAGTLVLGGTNSTAAQVSLSGGTLQIKSNAAISTGTFTLGTGILSTVSNDLTLANALSLAGNTTFSGSNNITFNGNATLTSNRVQTDNSTGVITYNGAISGAYYLSKKGTGTMAYTGATANTYSGQTYVYEGGLILGKTAGVNAVAGSYRLGDGVGNAASAWSQLNASNQIIDTSALSIYADGQLRLQTFSDTVASVALYGGSITGTGSLGLGTGTLSFSGTLGAQATISSGINLNASRTFTINDNGVADTDLTISGAIANGSTSSSLTKAGLGTLALSGASTFDGGTYFNSGTTLIGSSTTGNITAGPLGTGTVNVADTTGTSSASLLFNSTSGLIIANTLNLRAGSSGSFTLGGLNTSGVNTFSGNLTLGKALSLTAAAGGQVDFSGAISGAFAMTKIGAGTIKLSAANSYSGGTVINSGTLLLGTSGALGSGAVTLTSGTLDFGNNNTATVGSLTLVDGSLLGTGSSALTTAGAMNVSNGTISLILSGAGNFTKSSTGTVTLSGANLFSGVISVTGGTLATGITNALPSSSAVSISSGATLNLQNYNNLIGSLAGAGNVLLGSGTLAAGGNNTSTTYSGILSGTGGLTKNGSGTLILSGSNTYTGATIINGGTLQFGINDAINSASSVNVTLASGSTLNLANFSGTFGSIAGAGNISQGSGALAFGGNNTDTSFSGILSGSGGITKNGSGTTTFTGTNTTTGNIIVSNGKTTLSGASGALASATTFTLRTGATLELDNSSIENNNRIGNSTAITLNGGTFRLISDSNGTLESVGQLIVGSGNSTVQVTHNGNTTNYTRLTFSSLGTIANGATVNFTGSGGIIGADVFGPQIFITGQAYGLLGSWATVGADPAEYSTFGVRAYGDYYEGILGVTYNSTAKIVRLSSASLAAAYTLSNLGQTTDLGLNLTDISTIDLGTSSTRTLNLSGGSLIKSTTTASTISGSGILTAGGSLAGNLAISVTSGSNLTISSVIADNASASVGLSKADAGTLTLSGANTFSGNVFLNGGTTNIAAENNLGAAANDITFSGGTLHLTAGFTTTSTKILTVASNQSGTLDIDSNQSLTLSNTAGVLTSGNAASTLIKTGLGNLIVQNANTGFTGTLQINQGRAELRHAQSTNGALALNGGTLALVNNSSTNFGNTLNILASSTVNVDRLSGSGAVTHSLGSVNLGAVTWTVSGANAAALSVGAVTLSGAGTFNPTTADLTTGAIGGSFGLNKNGAGTLIVSNTSTYTGTTQINTGTLRLGLANALPTGTDLTVASGATFDLANLAASTASIAGTGSITLGSATFTTGSTTSTFSGIISGTGALTKTGNGTLTLSGANTYTGATTVNAGTLILNGSNRLGSSTDLTIASVATVSLAGNNLASSLSGAGTVALGSNTFTTGTNSSTFSGLLSGTGGLTKTGNGTLTLTGANTYSGTTSVNGGTLLLRNSAALGAAGGAIVLASGAELQIENDIALANKPLTTSGIFRSNSGTNSFSGNIALAASATISTEAGSLSQSGNIALAGNNLTLTGSGTTTLNGSISGNGGLTKTGSGLLVLAGNNTYTGTTAISTGTVQIASVTALGAIGSNNDTSVASGATLLLDEAGGGLNLSAEALSLSGTGVGGNGALRSNAGTNTWNGSITLSANASIQVDTDTLTLEGTINDANGTHALTKTGAGILLLSGTATYSGGTTISAGTFQLDNADLLLSTGGVSVASAATFDLDDNDQTIGTLIGAGIVQTGPTTTIAGGGTLTVGASNLSATFAGNIQGKGDLEKIGTATQTLSGTNSFIGATTISGGKLEAAANNALGSTATITINSGGTLLLSGSATDRIATAADIVLNGGTFQTNGGSEGTGRNRSSTGALTGSSTLGLGALSLTASSTLDFGTGTVSTLNFSSLTANGFILTILNYTRTGDGSLVDGLSDRLIFNSDQSSNLANFNFGTSFTPTQVSLGNGFYEVTVTPVPEPSTWLGALGISVLLVAELRRRQRVQSKPALG